ncbi:MAG: MBL fold metallo-hydrolase [Chthoniobacterales bacterium]
MVQTSSRSPHAFTRRDALRTLGLALGASALPGSFGFVRSAAAETSPKATPDATPPAVTVTSLGERLSLIAGLGGNIVLLSGGDGSLVIDCGYPNLAEKTMGELRKAGPLSMLVNTHWHLDHSGANQQCAEAGARIVAHENCRKRLATEQYIEPLDMKMPAAVPRALPNVTFSSETVLHLNGDDVRLVPVAPAHTDGDLIVRFEQADLIHFGDLFFHGMYPFIDWSSGGWIGGMVASVRAGLQMAGPKTRAVPGHGPLATTEELKSYLGFLETMQERFEKLKAEGKTADEVVAANPAKEFDEKLGQGFLKPEQFLRIAYTSLLKHG